MGRRMGMLLLAVGPMSLVLSGTSVVSVRGGSWSGPSTASEMPITPPRSGASLKQENATTSDKDGDSGRRDSGGSPVLFGMVAIGAVVAGGAGVVWLVRSVGGKRTHAAVVIPVPEVPGGMVELEGVLPDGTIANVGDLQSVVRQVVNQLDKSKQDLARPPQDAAQLGGQETQESAHTGERHDAHKHKRWIGAGKTSLPVPPPFDLKSPVIQGSRPPERQQAAAAASGDKPVAKDPMHVQLVNRTRTLFKLQGIRMEPKELHELIAPFNGSEERLNDHLRATYGQDLSAADKVLDDEERYIYHRKHHTRDYVPQPASLSSGAQRPSSMAGSQVQWPKSPLQDDNVLALLQPWAHNNSPKLTEAALGSHEAAHTTESVHTTAPAQFTIPSQPHLRPSNPGIAHSSTAPSEFSLPRAPSLPTPPSMSPSPPLTGTAAALLREAAQNAPLTSVPASPIAHSPRPPSVVGSTRSSQHSAQTSSTHKTGRRTHVGE